MHARNPRLTRERAHTHTARDVYYITVLVFRNHPFVICSSETFSRGWVQFVVASPPPPRGSPANYWMQILYPPADSPETLGGLPLANVQYLYIYIFIICTSSRIRYIIFSSIRRNDGAVSEISENAVTLYNTIYDCLTIAQFLLAGIAIVWYIMWFPILLCSWFHFKRQTFYFLYKWIIFSANHRSIFTGLWMHIPIGIIIWQLENDYNMKYLNIF